MDSVSSAQSKCVGRGETARLWSSLGELGQTGSEGGAGGGQGVFIGIDGVVSGAGGVWDAGGGEMVRCWGAWGRLGCVGIKRGCSDGSGGVFRCFRAVGSGLEWGTAGVSAVVVDDVAGP